LENEAAASRRNDMAKYLLAYHGGGMPETDAERATVLAAWERWFQALGPAVVDPGNPVSQVNTIRNGGTVGVHGDNPISGYSILEADSLEKANELAKGCPVLESGATIEVCETFNAM
jgi:hypothetical protein